MRILLLAFAATYLGRKHFCELQKQKGRMSKNKVQNLSHRSKLCGVFLSCIPLMLGSHSSNHNGVNNRHLFSYKGTPGQGGNTGFLCGQLGLFLNAQSAVVMREELYFQTGLTAYHRCAAKRCLTGNGKVELSREQRFNMSLHQVLSNAPAPQLGEHKQVLDTTLNICFQIPEMKNFRPFSGALVKNDLR